MTTTTRYGTWCNRVEPSASEIKDTVVPYLGDFVDDYDVLGIVDEYRDAINAALPPDVYLSGSEFVGPADVRTFDGYPTNEDGYLDIKAIVDEIDLDEILSRHDRTR